MRWLQNLPVPIAPASFPTSSGCTGIASRLSQAPAQLIPARRPTERESRDFATGRAAISHSGAECYHPAAYHVSVPIAALCGS